MIKPGEGLDSPSSTLCVCGTWLLSTSSLHPWPSRGLKVTLKRGVSWSQGAHTGFFRSQEGWEPPGMHFTASKEWVSSWQSKSTFSLFFFILKKGELLSLQQVPRLLEKVVSTSKPFPLPTAVLLGCAGQRPLESVFIFWFLFCCYFSSKKQTSQMLGPLHGASCESVQVYLGGFSGGKRGRNSTGRCFLNPLL